MKTFERILVATDFSPCSIAAAAVAAQLGRQLAAAVEIVHVIDTSGIMSGYGDTPFRAERLRDVRGEAEDHMTGFAAQHLAGLPDVAVHIADGKDPAAAILDAAKRMGADLIVMGTHGGGRLAHVLLGSVAEKVARTSAIPVLTVREAAPTPRELRAPVWSSL